MNDAVECCYKWGVQHYSTSRGDIPDNSPGRGAGVRPFDRRRSCSGWSITDQSSSTNPQRVAANPSTPITCDLQNPMEFNNSRNLVRDQEVGGSNRLSPTIQFPTGVSCTS